MTSEIYDATGKRIGIMTAEGPLFAADEADLVYLQERKAAERKRYKAERRAEHKARKVRDRSRMLELWEIDPRYIPSSLNDFTIQERRIIEKALMNNDSVSLAWVVKQVLRLKDYTNHTVNAVEQEMRRAADRLYNRGYATIEMRADSLIWVTVSRAKIHDLISKEIAERQQGATLNFNLMEEFSKIPTISSGAENPSLQPKIKRLPSDLPKKAHPHRMEAARRLKGIRMLERHDKVAINHGFNSYISEINEKIITLLDPTGQIMGAEYSTRFNDLAKAAANLDKFDFALENSFLEHKKAVFLTLTTDPNLPDAERQAIKDRNISDVENRMRAPGISEGAYLTLRDRLWKLKGPDYEIGELTTIIASGTLSGNELHNSKQRLSKLEHNKTVAADLQRQVDDPATPVRTRERMITAIKKLGRWEYCHQEEGYECLWDANRGFAPAWNKFIAYLTKKNDGKRPQYIAAYEYTDSGLMHIHALIFTEYLLSNEEISREWIRCGQGDITYIYGLKAVKKRDGPGWEWRWNAQHRPHKAGGMSGGNYLKKYVKKAMLALMDDYSAPAETQSMYWALNKRMFTCSRALQATPEQLNEKETAVSGPSGWEFYKVMSSAEAETEVDTMIYHRYRPKSKDDGDGEVAS